MLSGLRKPQRVAVFISGGGSTLQALLEMHFQIDLRLIVTNRKKAAGVLKAKRFGAEILHMPVGMSYSELDRELRQRGINRIILAGFMKMLPSDFVESWQGKIINIHPSLLPLYPGLHSAERSYRENSEMGVTVHTVVTEMDAGPVLLQQKSMVAPQQMSEDEACLFLRRTEQHLFRETVLRHFT